MGASETTLQDIHAIQDFLSLFSYSRTETSGEYAQPGSELSGNGLLIAANCKDSLIKVNGPTQ